MPDSQPAFENSFVESLERLGENLRHCLSKSRALGCLGPYVYAIGKPYCKKASTLTGSTFPRQSNLGSDTRATPSRI